ncbi:TetR family transcriptional regulator [Rhizobium tubonense]|uniref:TetR family transcriptional regulator n=1 Tax=Rhizobium tubonense TaxID=484088 RepID=A0A2W4CGG1_9HYPH|nr:TetR family transcriptional regulator [Rhizobium tubonense]PZM12112.1 TetR family transcriptional regulator [Rhizobium tubonense]
MIEGKDIDAEPREGRRERKRRQTRERIEQAAMALFLERGFDATTIEDITEAADVSKRSFFDYFPSKEDVVFAWQDSFADGLAAAIAERPADEPIVKVVEEALTSAITAALDPQSVALADLIRETPVLSARNQLKYAKLERKLTEALLARTGDDEGERLRIRLLSAVVVSTMRVGGERWHEQQRPETLDTSSLETFARDIFRELWGVLADFGAGARSAPKPE